MLTYNKYKEVMKRLMLCFQYKPQTADEAKDLLETYHGALSKSDITDEQFTNVAGRLIFSWKPEYGRKFPTVKEFIDIAGVSPSSIAEKAHKVLKSKIMKVGGYGCLDLGREHRHFVAMEAIRKMGGWYAICQKGVEEWEKNKSRFCKEFETLYYESDIPKKPLLGGSDAENKRFLDKYNGNQIESNTGDLDPI